MPLYFYGNPTDAPAPTDWSEYGFGTPAFVRRFETALQTASEEGILFDFSLGASQGQGTPAQQGSVGLAKHLVRRLTSSPTLWILTDPFSNLAGSL